MANIDKYSNGDPIIRAAGGNNAGVPDHVILRNTINMAHTDGAAIADTVDLLEIPANTVVTDVFLEVISGEATVTLAIGVTGDDPDGFIVATTLVTDAITRADGAYMVDVDGDVAKAPFFADDTMLTGLVAAAALTAAEFKVTVVGYNIG